MITDIDGSRILTPNEYQKLAARTICDQHRALDRVRRYNSQYELEDTTAIQLNHAVMGIGGEQGELCTALQRWIYYGKPFDDVNFVEELGDVLWYVAEACSALGIKLEDVMSGNISKLQVRYPEKYTDFHAAEENRDREKERLVLDKSMLEVSGISPISAKRQAECHCISAGPSLCDVHEAYRKSSTEAMECVARQTGPRPAIPVCPKCKTILNKDYCAECCERTV